MKHYLTLILALVTFASACDDDQMPPPAPKPPTCETDPRWCPPDPPVPPPDGPTDAEIQALYTTPDSASEREVFPYVKQFVLDGIAEEDEVIERFERGPKLRIKIASLDYLGSSVIGLCSRSASRREVTVDPDFWNRQSDTRKMMLMHHELGHCILFRPHRTSIGIIPDGSGHRHQLSNMYPVIFGEAQFKEHKAHYINETFAEAQVDPDQPPGTVVDICGPEDEMSMEVSEGAID